MTRLSTPNLAISQGVTPYIGLPIDDIKQAHQTLVMKNEFAHDQAGQLEEFIGQHRALTGNMQGTIDNEKSAIDGKLTSMVKNKDAHFRIKEMKSEARRIKNHRGLGSIREINEQYKDTVQHNEKVDTWDEKYKSAANDMSLSSVSGWEYDEKDNKVKNGNYKGIKLSEAPDFNKDIADLLKHFKPDTTSGVSFSEYGGANISQAVARLQQETGHDISPFIRKYSRTVETASESDIQKAVVDYIESTPKVQSYLNTKGMLDLHISNKGIEYMANGNEEVKTQLKRNRLKAETGKYLESYIDPSKAVAAFYSKQTNGQGDIQELLSKFGNLKQSEQANIIRQGVDIITNNYMTKVEAEDTDLDSSYQRLLYQNEMSTIAQLHGNVFGYVSEKIDADLTKNYYFDLANEKNKSDASVIQMAGGQVPMESMLKVMADNKNKLIELESLTANTNFDKTEEAKKLKRKLFDLNKNGTPEQVADATTALNAQRNKFNKELDENIKIRDYQKKLVEQDKLRRDTWLNENIGNINDTNYYKKSQAFLQDVDGNNLNDNDFTKVLYELAFDGVTYNRESIISKLKQYGINIDLNKLPAGTQAFDPINTYLLGTINKIKNDASNVAKTSKVDSPYAILHIDESVAYDELKPPIQNSLLTSHNNKIIYGEFAGETTADKGFRELIENADVEFNLAFNHYNNDGSFVVQATYYDRKSKKKVWSGYQQIFDSNVLQSAAVGAVIDDVNRSTKPLTQATRENTVNMLSGTIISSLPEYIGETTNNMPINSGRKLGNVIQYINPNVVDNAKFKLKSDTNIEIISSGKGFITAWLYIDGQDKVQVSSRNGNLNFTSADQLYPIIYDIYNAKR